MPNPLRILMAQINPIVGGIKSNERKILTTLNLYQKEHDVIVFPELAISGYPPEDLLLREDLHQQISQSLLHIQNTTQTCHVIVGHPLLENKRYFNAASVFYRGECIAVYHKQHLPNYGVFDELRYFQPGKAEPCIISIKGYRFGLCICEDIWFPEPIEQLLKEKIDGFFCLNASPFDYKKQALREKLLRSHAKKKLSIIYVNQVGGKLS